MNLIIGISLSVFTIVFIIVMTFIIVNRVDRRYGRVEREADRLEAENIRMCKSLSQVQELRRETEYRYLRVLRDYRFSQKANARHRRHIRRLRETLDLPEVKNLLARNADPAAHRDYDAALTARVLGDHPMVKVDTGKLGDPEIRDSIGQVVGGNRPTFQNDPLEVAGEVARTKLPKVATAL